MTLPRLMLQRFFEVTWAATAAVWPRRRKSVSIEYDFLLCVAKVKELKVVLHFAMKVLLHNNTLLKELLQEPSYAPHPPPVLKFCFGSL